MLLIVGTKIVLPQFVIGFEGELPSEKQFLETGHRKDNHKNFTLNITIYLFKFWLASGKVDYGMPILCQNSASSLLGSILSRSYFFFQWGWLKRRLAGKFIDQWVKYSLALVRPLKCFVFMSEIIDTPVIWCKIWYHSSNVNDESNKSFVFFHILRWLQLKNFVDVLRIKFYAIRRRFVIQERKNCGERGIFLFIDGEVLWCQPFHYSVVSFSELGINYTVKKDIILVRNASGYSFQHPFDYLLKFSC